MKKYYSTAKNVTCTHDRIYHHKLGTFSFPGATVNEKILLNSRKNVNCTHDRIYHHKLGTFSFPRATVNEKILLDSKKMLRATTIGFIIPNMALFHFQEPL
jgi:hypothetical protein